MAERIAWVRIYLQGSRSLRAVASEAGVSHQTLNSWVHEIIKSSSLRCRSMKSHVLSPEFHQDPRDAEILRLKAELDQALLKAHALDTMITIAERELNISIRKKAGAKQ